MLTGLLADAQKQRGYWLRRAIKAEHDAKVLRDEVKLKDSLESYDKSNK